MKLFQNLYKKFKKLFAPKVVSENSHQGNIEENGDSNVNQNSDELVSLKISQHLDGHHRVFIYWKHNNHATAIILSSMIYKLLSGHFNTSIKQCLERQKNDNNNDIEFVDYVQSCLNSFYKEEEPAIRPMQVLGFGQEQQQ